MKIYQEKNRDRLLEYFRQNLDLHIYSIGDLDDFYFLFTKYYALTQNEKISAIVFLYTAFNPPILQALSSPQNIDDLHALLEGLLPGLPPTVYTHQTEGLSELFNTYLYHVHYGRHLKMILPGSASIPDYWQGEITNLTHTHLADVMSLYENHYPNHAFDPRMLSTGHYFGLWLKGQLLSVAGVHVYSAVYRVAAIGNVVTHTDFRGHGFAKQVLICLCNFLRKSVNHIGLNVKADNHPALQLYKSLGFSTCAEYDEILYSNMDEINTLD